MSTEASSVHVDVQRVHSVWDYYDGPRSGVADHLGLPHYFVCDWDDASDTYADTYALSPIDDETLSLVLEKEALWRQWEFAFHSGAVSVGTHPGKGGRDARYDELQACIDRRLAALPAASIRVRAKFEAATTDDSLAVGVLRPLLVEWSPIP